MNPAPRAAVVLFVFQRPGPTAAVLEVLRAVRPPVLYVVADGPRPAHHGDSERCRLTRQVVVEGIDWPCEQHHLWSDANLGCDRSMIRGISWVFEREEQVIVLEDDCIPEPTFFRFCDELLERYRDDLRVTQVCGNNRLLRWKQDRQSYHFGYYGSAWGWATWRRAWELFDPRMTGRGDRSLMSLIESRLGDADEYRAFLRVTDPGPSNPHDISWDYRWAFSQIAQGGLTATAAVNLVRHVGFGPDSTHNHRRPLGAIAKSEPITFPLLAPAVVQRDAEFDHRHFVCGVGRPDADSAARFGQELIHAGRAIEALAVVHGVWQTHPGHRDIALVRARALMALNRPALAITLLDRLLAADPDDDEALCLRQVCGPHRA